MVYKRAGLEPAPTNSIMCFCICGRLKSPLHSKFAYKCSDKLQFVEIWHTIFIAKEEKMCLNKNMKFNSKGRENLNLNSRNSTGKFLYKKIQTEKKK